MGRERGEGGDGKSTVLACLQAHRALTCGRGSNAIDGQEFLDSCNRTLYKSRMEKGRNNA